MPAIAPPRRSFQQLGGLSPRRLLRCTGCPGAGTPTSHNAPGDGGSQTSAFRHPPGSSVPFVPPVTSFPESSPTLQLPFPASARFGGSLPTCDYRPEAAETLCSDRGGRVPCLPTGAPQL